MTERVYVALDLETTGLEATRDAILEIGAVRFQGDRILDRFQTLVNPQRPIPLRIQQITGIRNADVAGAPLFAEIAPELLAFVGGDVAAVVAHNVGFDLGFLRAAGLHFHRPGLDTFELATILLPNQVSYSLGELCRFFQIPLENAHRAAQDAEATAQLFFHLARHLNTLPHALLELIVEASQDADWPLRLLFADAHQAQLRSPASPDTALSLAWATAGHRSTPLSAGDAGDEPIPLERITYFFAADGPLAAQLGPDYEPRPGQQEMARRVMQALNQGDHLMIEAGTGTGKSLAYLLPAALWSVTNQQRVVIATNTINLQDQLLQKDIPQTQALLESLNLPRPRVGLLKGRNNYLCTRRLHAWRTDHRLTPPELGLLAKVLVWLTTTSTGDMSELLLATPADRTTWLRLCSDATTCSPERCGGVLHLDRHGLPAGDFFFQAQQQAESAHLLVINHALLLADLATGGRLLPTYEHLIVDEAHHLEEVTTEQLTQRIDWRWLQLQLQRLAPGERLLAQISAEAAHADWPALPPLIAAVEQRALAARRDLADFSARLLALVNGLETIRPEAGYAQRVALDSRLRSQPQWSQLEVEWDGASEALRTLVGELTQVVQLLDQAQWWQSEPTAALFTELRSLGDNLQTSLDQLDAIILAPKGADGLVKWLEINDNADTVTLAAAPLYVNTVIEAGLVHQRRSSIFTSATLCAGASFDFIRERLGLWEVKTATVESPFDYESSTLLILPTDLPAPNQPNYQRAVEDALLGAAEAAGGRTLALFTSYAQLRATAEAVRAPLDRANITVLQHGSGSRHRLLREYRETERAVLLGTRSFWEGIDLPGDDLTCLLIARLPFAVPSDPLVAARTADLEDAFSEYTLPDAVLRFRQGFGRLIRRSSDRGVVVLLDSRIWQRGYGRAFLESLPTCTVRRVLLSNLGAEIRSWLG
jgi:ATP-dependent DNA helicase DinG